MREMTLEELKKAELRILKYIDQVCKKNGIPYYLDGGTLLGAVRHKGFIPWDDDIDIIVPRQHYGRFCKAINEEQTGFRMVCYENEQNYVLPYGKVCDTQTIIIENTESVLKTNYGVFVDVFPLDNYPNGRLERAAFVIKCKYYRSLWGVSAFRKPVHNLRDATLAIISYRKTPYFYSKKLNGYLSRYGTLKAKFCRDIIAAGSLDKLGKSSWFEESVELRFEDAYFPAPVGYKEYLTMLYGDYMKLPPKEKQVTQHTFKAYYKEENQ